MKIILIDEYICKNNIKVQLYEIKKGFTITISQNGVIKSTIFTEDQQQAREIYQDRCKQFD